jgi:hypothetical protein
MARDWNEMKRKPKYDHKTLKLKDNHTWKAPPGHFIVVLDKGAVRLNMPVSWAVVPEPDSVKVYDRQPPDDDCCLAVSYLRLPPIDWSGLPLTDLITNALQSDERDTRPTGSPITEPRSDIELTWAEYGFIDPIEKRPALSRLAIARGHDLQALLTFDFWVDDTARLESVWREVMRSVELGRYVSDPTRGDVLH